MTLKDLADRVGGFFNGAGNAIQHAAQPVEHNVSNFVQHIPQEAINFGNLAGGFGQHLQQVVVKSPLLNTPTLFSHMSPTAGILASPQHPLLPAPGQYVKGMVQQPIQQGIKQVQQPGFMNKGMGAMQIGQGVWNATPYGIAGNAVVGAATGVAKTIRTGTPIDKNIREAISNPTHDLGHEGLGIQNPIIAGGVDLATGLNPKSLAKGAVGAVKGLKGYSPRGFDIHPDDQKIMADFVNAVQTGAGKANLGQLGKDAQVLAEHYIGSKAKGITNEKLANAFDALLSSAAQGRGEDVMQTSFPKMGFAGKGQTIGEIQQSHQSPDLTSYEKAFNANDTKTLATLAAKNPGDVRFQVHLGINKTGAGITDTNLSPEKQALSANSFQREATQTPQMGQSLGLEKMMPQSAGQQSKQLPSQQSIPQPHILDQFKTGSFKDSTNPEGGDLFTGVKGAIDKAYTDTLDRFHPISVLGKKAGADDKVRNALTGYYGTGSIAKYHTDFELSPILKSVDPADLRAYTVAQRDLELAGRNIQGSNRGNSQQILDALKEKHGGNLQQLDQAATKLYDYQKNLVKTNLVDTGIMSKESFDAMTANNRKYVPFQRVMDQVDSFLGVPGKSVGSVGSQNVIKGITGSTKEIKDPLQSIIENTYKVVGLGQRQKVAQTIVGLKDKLPAGMIRPFEGKSLGNESTISLFENGKVKKYEVPKEVADAAKGMTSDQMGTIVKILAAPTRVFRATATGANPEFALPNTARDLQSAFVNVGLNPLKFANGLAHYLKKDNIYQEFLKSGGMTSRISLDKPFLKQSVKDLTGVKTKGIALTKPSEIYKMVQAVGNASEQPTRIAAFKKGYNQALKSGKSIEEARLIGANTAQESSVNFARRGAKTQSINSVFAFLNARAQGTDRLIRAFKNDPVGVGYRVGLITAAPALALYAHNRQYQSYNDPNVVAPYDKQNNFIWMLSDSPLDQFGGAQYIKIPKGDVGKLANPLESFMSFADGKGGDTQASLVSALSAFSPIGNAGDLIPTALRPGVENAANHNFFSGFPIVSESKKNYPAPFQTSKSTPAIYNQIGSLTNQSPNMIQNLARGYGTGYARLAETATQPLSNTDNYSGQDINNVPVIRRFVGGAKKSPEEAQQNAVYQQQAVQKQIQDIRTGVKYGNIPYEEGMNKINQLMNTQQEQMKTQPQSYFGPQGASASTDKTNPVDQLKQKMQLDQAKMQVEQSGTSQTIGSKIIYNDNGSIKTLDLTPPTKGAGIDAFTNQNWNVTKAIDVFKNQDKLTPDQANAAFKQLGVDPQDARYAYLATHSTDVSTQYIVSKSPDHKALINNLTSGRVVGINGQQFAANAVVDAIYNKGLITKEEATALKKLKVDKNGKSLVAAGAGKAKKGKKLTIKATAAPKIKSIKSTTFKISKAPKMKIASTPTLKIAKAKPQPKYRIANIKTKFSSHPTLTA